jgi:hypothetical protein
MSYSLYNSNRKTKKYMVITPDGYKVHFGASGYEDYTIHKDNERKNRYIQRHKKNEDWNNTYTPGFWALHLLWNKPTIKESIEDIKRNYGIRIINKI